MRLFIAIELPKSFKAELYRAQGELKALGAGGRFVPEENFHITLNFLGEQSDVYGLTSVMKQAVRGIRPFTLHLAKYGAFSHADGQVAYVNVAGELTELNVLRESLVSALLDGGFSCERKRFTPHITLGRAVALPPGAEESLKALSFNASLTVAGIALYVSERRESGMRYSVLHREKF